MIGNGGWVERIFSRVSYVFSKHLDIFFFCVYNDMVCENAQYFDAQKSAQKLRITATNRQYHRR